MCFLHHRDVSNHLATFPYAGVSVICLKATGALRNSEENVSGEREKGSLSVAVFQNSSLFPPYTPWTSLRQLAPTVKPSPLQSVRENEKQSPKRVSVCCFFFKILFSLFFPFFGRSWIFPNINAELSLQSDWYQKSFFVGLHAQKYWASLCFAVWQAEI